MRLETGGGEAHLLGGHGAGPQGATETMTTAGPATLLVEDAADLSTVILRLDMRALVVEPRHIALVTTNGDSIGVRKTPHLGHGEGTTDVIWRRERMVLALCSTLSCCTQVRCLLSGSALYLS